MVAVKTTLLLLKTVACVIALPARNEEPEYNINGELLSASANKRSHYYPICWDDPDYWALERHKEKASPFCSSYLGSTKTITVTPTIYKTATRSDIRTVTVQDTRTVTSQTTQGATVEVTETDSTTITETATAHVTSTLTDQATVVITEDITQTVTDLETSTATAERTDDVTTQITDTVTVGVTDTITDQVTHTVTGETTETASTTITVTATAATPTATVTNNYHCAVAGYGTSQYNVGNGPSSAANFDGCKAFCSTITSALSFGYGGGQCACYGVAAGKNVRPAATQYLFYDLACPSQNAPSKRDVKRTKFPDWLPCDDPRDISRACSCLITKPVAPFTTTVTVCPKRISATVTKSEIITATDEKTVTETIHKILTTTRDESIERTDYRTVTITDHDIATVTNTATIRVTDYDTLTLTDENTVSVTVHNTAYFTNTNVIAQTSTGLITDTNTNFATITDTITVIGTSTATVTVTPSTVTVTATQTGFTYGS